MTPGKPRCAEIAFRQKVDVGAPADLFRGVVPFGNKPLRRHPIADEPSGASRRDGSNSTSLGNRARRLSG